MESHQKEIIIALMSKGAMSGEELSGIIKMTTRSVRSIVKSINEDVKGAHIISGNFGYKLDIQDPEVLISYMQENHKEEDRLTYLFMRFIDTKDYLKIDDLCEELYLSRTQLKESLKNLRLFLNDYDVSIETKVHQGLRLFGSELNIRRAIAHYEQYQKDSVLYNKIKDILISCLINDDCEISDDNLDNLTSHLYIAYKRVMDEDYIVIDHTWWEELKHEKEYPLAYSIMSVMNKMLGMTYREEETGYLTMHLCGKNTKQYEHKCIDQDILDLVNEMLLSIEEQSHISFTSDLNLQLALCLHMIPLVKRIQYGTYMHNPLVNDIRARLIVAYELAIKACLRINEKYDCNLPEDEIAYFALHINLSLEQRKTSKQKKNILLVCSSGVGSARMLEYFFKQHFSSDISRLEVCSLHELNQMNVHDFDCIFTTVPISHEVSIPIFMIHTLMNKSDTIKIQEKLKTLDQSNIAQYFPKELFFANSLYETKEEAIHQLIKECHKYYDLPSNYESLVLERESMATTELNDLIAFPHSHKPVSSRTFVCVAILKKPILWKQRRIRLIFLSSVDNHVEKELEDFYKVISTLLSDATLQWQLINHPDYDYFLKMIEGILNL